MPARPMLAAELERYGYGFDSEGVRRRLWEENVRIGIYLPQLERWWGALGGSAMLVLSFHALTQSGRRVVGSA